MLTAWFLDQEGCDVTLHNNPDIQAASGIAAGLINPITGKRFAKTWMADEIFPFAIATYESIQQTIGQTFFQPINIMRLADTISQVNDWEARAQNDAFKPYIGEHTISTEIIGKLAESKGVFNIKGGAKINTAILLKGIKDYFEQKKKLVNKAYTATSYKENECIIYCNGTAIHSVEGLSGIPVIPVKGHYLVCAIPELDAKEVIQGAVSIIPQEDGLYRIGSTYQWEFAHNESEQMQIDLLTQNLKKTIRIPFTIESVMVGIRPTSDDRRPILGGHPTLSNVYILNGLGTKGYSLAPYFAKQLVDFIVHGTPIEKEVNIARFLNANYHIRSL